MANVVFNSLKRRLLEADIDFAGDTIKVALVTDAYTPDQDDDEFFDDITGEVEDDGYDAGGKTLVNPAVTQDNANNRGKFDAEDVTWEDSSITARAAVIYKDSGDPGASPLIAYIDFGEDKVSENGDFTIEWDEDGILTMDDVA